MTQRNGFTIRELALVIVMILILIALVIPSLSVTRPGGARQMPECVQVRDIQSGLIILSQTNNGFFLGREKDGARSPQADVAWRFQTLVTDNFFASDYVQSPLEAAPARGYSYDMTSLGNTAGRRFDGWRDTNNALTPAVSDRLTAGIPSLPGTYRSIHTTKPGEWRGAVGYNDNHVNFESTAVLSTNDGKNSHPKDDLFYPESGDDALMIYAGT